MFDPVKKLYKRYGEDTEELIFYLLSYIEIAERFEEGSREYDYCMNELENNILEIFEEDFLSECDSFCEKYCKDSRLISALFNGEHELLDLDIVLKELNEKTRVEAQTPVLENTKNLELLVEDAENEELKKCDNNSKYKKDEELKKIKRPYKYPPLSLLNGTDKKDNDINKDVLLDLTSKLQKLFYSQNINLTVVEVKVGPQALLFIVEVEVGISIASIKSMNPDIKMILAAREVEIIAPIPGTSNIGIKIPIEKSYRCKLKDSMFANLNNRHKIPIAKTDLGEIITFDYLDESNLLIAGTTGAGKSEMLDTIIMFCLMKYSPDELKFILVDTHSIQLSVYNGCPHLLLPTITDARKAVGAMHWLVREALSRLEILEKVNLKNIDLYNDAAKNGNLDSEFPTMPRIFLVIDDYGDVVQQSCEVNDVLSRLCSVARIAGIHIILSIQRPSVDSIPSEIRNNFLSRIAFKVVSGIDSKIVLDTVGAEDICTHGEFLYKKSGSPEIKKALTLLVTEREIHDVVSFISNERFVDIEDNIKCIDIEPKYDISTRDPLFAEAGRFIIENQKGSIGYLQRNFRIGFHRAARIMDQLAEAGVVGPELGTKPREIKMTISEFEQKFS